jgi:alpha-beta hydrolase superfamily lysophospholipase
VDIKFFSLETNSSTDTAPESGRYMRYLVSRVENPIGVVVAKLGKSEWAEKYFFELADELAAHGIRLIVPEWLGQGGSSPFIAPVDSINPSHSPNSMVQIEASRQFEASDDFQNLLKDPNGEKLRFLRLCHSYGSQKRLLDGCERGGSEDAQFFLSTLIYPTIPPKTRFHIPPRLLMGVAWTACKLGYGETLAQRGYNPATEPFEKAGLTSDRRRYEGPREFLRKEENRHLITGGATWQELYNMLHNYYTLRKAAQKAQANFDTLFPNSIMVGAGRDSVASDGEELARNFGIPFFRIEGARHELLFERDAIRQPVINLILGFFGQGPNPLKPGMRLAQLMRRNLISSSPQTAPA